MKTIRAIAFNESSDAGFTLIELFAIIVSLSVLSLLLLPALAGTKPNSAAFQCLENQRQLVRAWQMYAEDYAGGLVAADGSSLTSQYNGRPVWLAVNLQGDPGSFINGAEITNSPLWAYAGRNATIFRCPSDPSTVVVAGKAYPRARTINMSGVFGSGSALTPDNWRVYAKTAEIVKPANTFLFIDERALYLNDGSFAVQCNGLPGSGTSGTPAFISLPASYHNKAAGLSFADGHAVMRIWRGNIILTATNGIQFSVSTATDLADYTYLASNTTVLK